MHTELIHNTYTPTASDQQRTFGEIYWNHMVAQMKGQQYVCVVNAILHPASTQRGVALKLRTVGSVTNYEAPSDCEALSYVFKYLQKKHGNQ